MGEEYVSTVKLTSNHFYLKKKSGEGVRNSLASKLEDPSSSPRVPVKEPGVMGHAYSPSNEKAETSRSLGLTSQPA